MRETYVEEDQNINDLRSYGLEKRDGFLREKGTEFKLGLFREITMNENAETFKKRESDLPLDVRVSRSFGWKRPIVWAVAGVVVVLGSIGLARTEFDSGQEVAVARESAAVGESAEVEFLEMVSVIEAPVARRLARISMEEISASDDFGDIDEELLNREVAELERTFSEEEILDQYVEKVYFGNTFHGVDAATEGYWKKPLSELGVCNLAVLVGIIERPGYYNPAKFPSAAESRRNEVLKTLESQGYVTADQVELCRNEPINLAENDQ